MPKICEVINPMNPMDGLRETVVEVGFNTDDYVPQSPGLKYHVSINNRPSFQGAQLHAGDVAVFVPCVNGAIGIGIIIAIIVAAAVFFFIGIVVPTTDGLPEPDPVYSFKGQQNQIKEGDAIEKHYGQVRHWPSYAARPYNQFIGDEQWLYALLCVGIGDYEVTEVLVDDTPIGNFANAEYAIYKPGEIVTLFPTNVQTSSEVGGIELLGTNEAGHDWSGPFVIVSSTQRAYRIEIDLAFRSGLYKTNDEGKLRNVTATATFEIRQIDDSGVAMGGWTTLLNFSKTLKTTDSKRFTIAANVADGRYEIRGKRTNSVSSDFKQRSTMTWESARTFIKTTQNFGDVTLLAIKVQASNNLNDNSRNKFNVRVRSKAWMYSTLTSSWSIGETRSPVWAACDILIARYGRNIPTRYIDIDKIVELAAELEAAEIYFDGTFDQRGTVWQAISDCLMSSRCRPNLPGTQFSIVRDSQMTLPTLCLNGHNIIKDSVKVNHDFVKASDKDSLEVEYVDPVTWERKTVLCRIGFDQGGNPEKVKLPGCKDRNLAYRWGMYLRATRIYQRTNVAVSTGIEGATVSFGDLVAMQHDLLPNDEIIIPEHTGRLAGDAYNDVSTTVIPLPFPPVFEEGEIYRIGIRDRDGKLLGPFVCTQGEESNVVIDSLLDVSQINVTGSEEVATYFFGVTGKEVSLFKIIGISPGDYGIVNLTLAPYDERLYTFDELIAPAEGSNFSYPTTSTTPVVTNLVVSQLPQTLTEVVARWTPAVGAIDYIVEIKTDDDEYQRYVQVPFASANILVEPGHLYVRVAAVGINTGPWAYWDGDVGVPTNPPFKADPPRVSEEFTGTNLYLECDAVPLATSYKWKTYIGIDLISTYTTDFPSFSYSSTQAKADAALVPVTLSRTLKITVTASNAIGDGDESDELEVTNPAPPAPTGLSSSVAQDLTGTKRCIFLWSPSDDLDLELYRFHGSTVTGFTPGPSNLLSSTVSLNAEAIITTGVPFYWVVGAKDRWGDDISFSGEETITP